MIILSKLSKTIDKNSLKEISIEELRLSLRSLGIIKKIGIDNALGLVRLTEEEFLSLPGCGEKTLREARSNLAILGLSFSPLDITNLSEIEKSTLKLLIELEERIL